MSDILNPDTPEEFHDCYSQSPEKRADAAAVAAAALSTKSTKSTKSPKKSKNLTLSPSKRKRLEYHDTHLLKNLIVTSLRKKLNTDKRRKIDLTNVENIGQGSFSQVYKATVVQIDSDKPMFIIAIKVITTQSSAPRMLREAEILQEAHDLKETTCIMPILSLFSGQKAGYIGIVQPYIPHSPFEAYYSSLTNDQVTAYMKNLLTALKTVHKLGYVHRDIKPANFIFIPKYKSGYLIDFGLAETKPENNKNSKITRKSSSTSTNLLERQNSSLCDCDRFHDKLCVQCWSRSRNKQERSGTPGYRSPEILQKSETQGPPIDLWATGCILIQILSKRAPFFPPNKEEMFGDDEPSHHDNLDNDSICFSDQLSFVGIPAMESAMKELKLNLKFSKEDKNDERLNFDYDRNHVKRECKKLSLTSESNLDNYDFSENLYDLLFKLLQPSYCNRITAEKALLLLD